MEGEAQGRKPKRLHEHALSFEDERATHGGEPFDGVALSADAEGKLVARRYRDGRASDEPAALPLVRDGESVVDQAEIEWRDEGEAFWRGQRYEGLVATFESGALHELERFADGEALPEAVRFHPDGDVAARSGVFEVAGGHVCEERYTFDESGACLTAMLELDEELIAAIESDGKNLTLLLFSETYFRLEASLAAATRDFALVSLSRAEWMPIGERLKVGGLAAAHEGTIVEGLAERLSGGTLEVLEIWRKALTADSLARLLAAGRPGRVEVRWDMPGARERLQAYARERDGVEIVLDGVRLP